MKHIQANARGALTYVRKLPVDVQALAQRLFWKRGMGVNQRDPIAKVQAAWSKAHEDFEAMLDYWRSSGAGVIEQQRLHKIAEALLREHGLDVGVAADWPAQGDDMGPAEVLQAQIPEFDVHDPSDTTLELFQKSLELFTSRRGRPVYLGDCWGLYQSHKGIDVSSREGKRIKGRWERWLSVTGEHLLTKEAVESGMDRWRDRRYGESVATSSIRRELNTIAAVVRHTIETKRLGFNVSVPKLKAHTAQKREVLNRVQQQTLVRHILSLDLTPKRKNLKLIADGAALLLQLQGAVITSECMRLSKHRLFLDSPTPYLTIDGQTKTEARKRIVPVTVGLNWLRKAFQAIASREDGSELAFGSEWAQLTESALSKRLERFLSEAGTPCTSYSMRHTFRANTLMNNAGGNAAMIAGWSSPNGASRDMLNYGRAGLENPEVLRGLAETSKVVNLHLLDLDSARDTNDDSL